MKAIVLAGKDEVHPLVNQFYRFIYSFIDKQRYLWTEYKPTRNISKERDHYTPLVYPVIRTLDESHHVDDITIIGRKDELDESLADYLFVKPIQVVQQVGRIASNCLEAYYRSGARGHVLIVPCDIPKIYRPRFKIRHTREQVDGMTHAERNAIDSFVEQVTKGYGLAHDLYFAITSEEAIASIGIRRHGFKLVPDAEFDRPRDPAFEYSDGRYMFKDCNLFIADAANVSPETLVKIDKAMSARKAYLNPIAMKAIFELAGSRKKEIFLRYFVDQNLTISRLERIASEVFDISIKLVEVSNEDAKVLAHDIDSEEDLLNLNPS